MMIDPDGRYAYHPSGHQGVTYDYDDPISGGGGSVASFGNGGRRRASTTDWINNIQAMTGNHHYNFRNMSTQEFQNFYGSVDAFGNVNYAVAGALANSLGAYTPSGNELRDIVSYMYALSSDPGNRIMLDHSSAGLIHVAMNEGGKWYLPHTNITYQDYLALQALGGGSQVLHAGGFSEDYRNLLTGMALTTEGYAIRELKRIPKNPKPGTRHITKLRTNYLTKLAKRSGLVGTAFSAWETTEKGWTTGATSMFAADVGVAILSIACPVCGIVYGLGRLAVDLYGYDVADQIDKNFGANTLYDNVGRGWDYITGN